MNVGNTEKTHNSAAFPRIALLCRPLTAPDSVQKYPPPPPDFFAISSNPLKISGLAKAASIGTVIVIRRAGEKVVWREHPATNP